MISENFDSEIQVCNEIVIRKIDPLINPARKL